jgi:hypothetical protein
VVSVEISLPVIKTENEEFICDHQNCGLKFTNGFKLSVHRRTHIMRQKQHTGEKRHKCPNTKCGFMTNVKSNYTKHMSICQKNIFKCDFDGCEDFFTKVVHLRRHKQQFHNLNTTQLTQIQLTQNDSTITINNNTYSNSNSDSNSDTQKSNENREVQSPKTKARKYRKQQRNNCLKRNVFGDYQCYYGNCGKLFKEKIRLVYHLRTHTE